MPNLTPSEKKKFADFIWDWRKDAENLGYVPSVNLLLESLEEEFDNQEHD